ncbi:MAG TPA: MFS transporter [Chthonomonadales bacterium]|nr:MFS transporter [Chthonomonadales bacterium]
MSSPSSAALPHLGELTERQRKLLFWACFIALVATSFCFIIRALLLGTWGDQFGWNETQKGQILGVGLWPFAVSIIVFSLMIDKIGYGRSMVFAFVCHMLFAAVTIMAPGMDNPDAIYYAFWVGSLLGSLAAGTVEAVINPVVAAMYPREKVKWLSILHAGWPGGLVLGGILVIATGGADWRLQIGFVFIPTILYGVAMLGRKFPVCERVSAGVSYRDMLREFGVVVAFIAACLIFLEVGRAFFFPVWLTWALIIGSTVAYGLATGFAPGRWLFIVLVLIMMPLATTELGTDAWITELMKPEMERLGLAAGWVLVYTSALMMVLRLFAGSIVHRMSPLALLAISSVLAMAGLVALSASVGVMILLAATLYGIGKSFFWPAMLGIVSEQFPKGGAMTLNGVAGLGMLAVGTVGAPFLGYIQDSSVNTRLRLEQPVIHSQVADEKRWVFGAYQAVVPERVAALPLPEDREQVERAADLGRKDALRTVAIFPAIMLVAYLLLMLYFRSKGGYKPVIIGAGSHGSPPAGG